MSVIGFIGLGHMGRPMVENLLKQGYTVVVYDIATDVVKQLAKAGAVAADSIAKLADQAEVVITMLQTGEQVNACCLGEQGVFSHLRKGGLYIDSSSIDIAVTRQLHQQAQSIGLTMVDAPVSGGVAGAQAASLTIMVGGTQSAFERAQPILQCLGKSIIHAGDAGNGQAAKICNNMILGISMIAVSEGFALGEKLGLDAKTFFDIASRASSQCWSMTSYCPVPNIIDNVPANNDYQPGFTAQMMLKDLLLSQTAAKTANAKTPLGKQATELYQQFIKQGNSELDFSGIIKMLQERL